MLARFAGLQVFRVRGFSLRQPLGRGTLKTQGLQAHADNIILPRYAVCADHAGLPADVLVEVVHVPAGSPPAAAIRHGLRGVGLAHAEFCEGREPQLVVHGHHVP